MERTLRSAWTRATVVAFLAVAAPGVVWAQGGDGFLFREPRVTLTLETGYGFQRAQGDVFDYVVDTFTVGRRDFDSPYVGAELSIRVDDRWDVAFAAGFQSSSTTSEYRDYVGTDGLPIQQVTELRLVPVSAGAKYYLKPRGRSIGRFAWIPEKVVPYVGAGIGVMSYRLEQDGEFIDTSQPDWPIFVDRLETAGSTFLARALAGVDVAVHQRLVLSGEARYNLSRGPAEGDYRGFGDMTLDGLQLAAGIGIRF